MYKAEAISSLLILGFGVFLLLREIGLKVKDSNVHVLSANFLRTATVVFSLTVLVWVSVRIIPDIRTLLQAPDGDYEAYGLRNKMTGQYAYGYWTPVIIPLILVLLIWTRKVRNSFAGRILVGITILIHFIFKKVYLLTIWSQRDYIISDTSDSIVKLMSDTLLYSLGGTVLFIVLTLGLNSILGRPSIPQQE